VNRAGGGDTFSCRWTGYVKLDNNELYTFYTYSDDGVRLWVNNILIINNWTDHGATENIGKNDVSGYAHRFQWDNAITNGKVLSGVYSHINYIGTTIPNNTWNNGMVTAIGTNLKVSFGPSSRSDTDSSFTSAGRIALGNSRLTPGEIRFDNVSARILIPSDANIVVTSDLPEKTTTCGNIVASETWNLAGSPYIITCDVGVPAGTSLTIQAGVEVRFNGGTKLIIRQNAWINVQGTADNRVIFTSNAASPNPGQWGGLHIWGNGRLDNSSTIQYAEFYYAHGNTSSSGWPSAYDPQSALNIRDASPLIQNSLFDRNFVGIAVSGRSNPVINNTRFFRNSCEAITFVPGSEPIFQNVIFGSLADGLNNGVEALGLGRDWYNAVGPVENATIRNVPGIFRGSLAPANEIINIPYVLHAQFRVNDGIQLTIDPGVVIKIASECNPINRSIVVNAGGSIKINGTAAEPVIFTSVHDDFRGAPSNRDTNLNGSTTLANPGQWEGLHIWGNGRLDNSSTIQYAEFHYADGLSSSSGWPAAYDPRSALRIVNASPLIQNSLFDSNLVGIAVEGRSNPVINNTRFFRNAYVPISFIPGSEPVFQDVIFGSLADGLNNGFEALGLGRDWYNAVGPVENATIRRIDQIYRGSKASANQITNIAYVLRAQFNVNNGIQLTIDPGVVIKMGPSDPRAITLEDGRSYNEGVPLGVGSWIRINSGGSLISTGENCNVVSFTSTYDDTRGRDANLDGSGTTPAPGQYSGLSLSDGSSANITYTEFLYAGNAISMDSTTA